jgi:hypothetical protein
MANAASTGGVMLLADISERLVRKRGHNAANISQDDVVRAIETLQVLGSGYNVVHVPGKGRCVLVLTVLQGEGESDVLGVL